MSEPRGTLAGIAAQLAGALKPLEEGFKDPEAFRVLLFQLGWDARGLPPSYLSVSDKAVTSGEALQALAEDPGIAEALAVVTKVGDAYRAIRTLNDAPAGIDPALFLPEFGRRLFELLLGRQLLSEAPRWFAALRTLGVISFEDVGETDDRPGFTRLRFDWDRIPELLSDPTAIPKRVYGWGTPDFAFEAVAELISHFMNAAGLPTSLDRISPELAASLQGGAVSPRVGSKRALTVAFFDIPINGAPADVGVMLAGIPQDGSAMPGMILLPLIPRGIETRIDLGDGWAFVLRAGTDLAEQLGVVVRPTETGVRYPFAPGHALPSGGFGIGMEYSAEGSLLLFGKAGQSRLELKGASITSELDFRGGELELRLQAAPKNLQLILSGDDLDGFLSELLGRSDRTIPIVLDVQWSDRTGFSFTGGAGLEISTHPHVSLGPIRVERIDLAIRSTVDATRGPELTVRVGTALAGTIGPVTFSLDGLGVTMSLVFEDGNAGPFDIDYGFAPPKGLGIGVDAGPISGGGFLSFDKEKHRYAGALELKVFEIAVKAIGFVETKLPNGEPGYSFLILIAAEFTPIQLGLGFTLNGVGGLVALHRRMDVDAVWTGMLAGSVDDVLYPKDPIGDAPRIISELATLFPPARNHFVFAPTALIGWGTPTIVRAELAIVFEPPSPLRVTLLGLISSTLPTEELAIVKLHVAVLGKIDFARRRLAIDAKLYDSSIAGFALTGDMAARVTWGFPPSVVVALGGLNPHFEPPADFPSMDRLTLALGTGDNPKLTCQAYFAITPNTLQFGVRAELYAAAAGFNIRGLVSFDCLVQHFPLSFRADMEADVAFRRGERVLASVHLEASMTGPVPYHVWGKASLSLWLFSVSVPFNVTFGPRWPQPLPSVNPWPLLQAAIQDLRNWTAEMPIAGFSAITLRTPTGGTARGLLDPGGVATLRQSVVPLNRRITRFGGGTPEGPDRYAVTTVTVNTTPAPDPAAVTEYFAAAQFEDLSDTEKLSRPSFELMDAGLSIGRDVLTAGASVGATLEYETIILDAPWQRRKGTRYTLAQDLQLRMLEQGASRRISSRNGAFNKFAVAGPSRVAFEDEVFVIASTAEANVVPGFSTATTKGAALAALADHLKAHPEDHGQFQVMPQSELLSTP